MSNLKSYLLAASLLLLPVGNALAQVPGAPNQSPNISNPFSSGYCYETFSHNFWTVFYVNGINATPEKNVAGLQLIREAVEARYNPYIEACDQPDFDLIAFEYVAQHNPSQKLLDIPETLLAIEGNIWSRKLRALYLAQGGRDRGPDDYFADYLDVKPEIVEALYNLTLNTVEADYLSTSANQWAAALNKTQKRCPLVVGYSQGSILANRIYQELETIQDPSCTSMIHIGSPDNTVFGEASNYVTLQEDLIIAAVRLVQSGNRNPLPANVDNTPFQPRQELGHSLGNDYLKGGNSRNRINRALDNSIFCNSKGDAGNTLPSVVSDATCPYLTTN